MKRSAIYIMVACAVLFAAEANARPRHRVQRTLAPAKIARPTVQQSNNAARLPLRDVVLFSSGVGYFGRAGFIRDKASIPLSFRVENINDILKSLVLFDAAGGVRSVTYGSQNSLARQLQLSGINVNSSLSLGAILRQFQGAQVAVTVGGKTVYGRILSVSVKVVTDKNGTNRQVEMLNLATASGLRTIALDNIGAIKLLDPSLDARLQSSLKLMANAFDDTRRSVHLNFAGRGVRQVRAGYLQAAPIWKSSYRLVLDKGAQPYLQGWAIVENTSDEDWNRVNLSLVSGRPISFIQDLYSPLYIGRAIVAPQLVGSPVSQLYGDAVDGNESLDRTGIIEGMTAPRGAAGPKGDVGPMGPQGAASGGFGGGGYLNKGAANGPTDQAHNAFAQGMLYDNDLARRSDIAASALAGVASQAAGAARGELFEYAIRNPVSIRRQSAAMVPIVSGRIVGEKISIYDADSSAQNALSGLRLTNTSGMQLAGGPITVFQNGIYAGDAQINTLGRGEHRYVSYAVDLELVATREVPTYRREITKVRLNSGVLSISRREIRDVLYSFRNKAREAKTILVVQKIEPDFKVVATQKVAEKTDTELRFKVWAPAGQTTKFKVVTERPIEEGIALVNADLNLLLAYAQNMEISPAAREALSSLVVKRRRIAELDEKIARLQTQINEISADQSRIRQNMDRLNQESDLRKRYLTKLNDQETKLEAMNEELALARDERDEAQKDLQRFVDTLTLD